MADDSFQEKTEPATDKRRSESRKKGKVAKSIDLNGAFAFLTGIMILNATGTAVAMKIADVARDVFGRAASMPVTASSVHEMFVRTTTVMALALAPILIGLLMVGVAVNYVQVGFLFSAEALAPKFNKLNPLTGISKVFGSRRSAVELLKSMLKVVVLAVTAYMTLESVVPDAMLLMDSDPGAILGFLTSATLSVGLKVGMAFLALAVLDYFYQKFEYEKELKMSKQEVKDESKMMEGDPMVKGRIRTVQRQIAYKRMMQDVPKADVVVTNPTHFAIALKYDALKMAAPVVVAKGADLVAQRIREIALEHNVPIVEDKPLARLLFKSVDVGDPIPQKLFQAVAQVLAYIYRLKSTKTWLN